MYADADHCPNIVLGRKRIMTRDIILKDIFLSWAF